MRCRPKLSDVTILPHFGQREPAASLDLWAGVVETSRRCLRTTRSTSGTSSIHSTGSATFRSFPETKPDYHLLLATYPILLGRSIPRARFVDKYSFNLNTDATGDDSLWHVTPLTSHLKSRMCGLSNPGLCTKPSV